MGVLRFLSRVAFICNICFILVSFCQWLPHFPDTPFTSEVLVLGWLVSLVVNVVIGIALLVVLLIGRLRKTGIRSWILIVNFLVFAVQLTLIYLNRNLK